MHEGRTTTHGVGKYRPVIRSVGVGDPGVRLCETSNCGRSECGPLSSAVPTSREGLGHDQGEAVACVCKGAPEDGTEEE